MAIESLTADLALERSMIGVDDLMATQSTGESKPFATNRADKWPFLSVLGHLHVFRKSVPSFENFSAMTAFVLVKFFLWFE